ncbi:MAG: hypothetical protein ACO3IB_07855, partial [Phycisphaerales bacterium]
MSHDMNPIRALRFSNCVAAVLASAFVGMASAQVAPGVAPGQPAPGDPIPGDRPVDPGMMPGRDTEPTPASPTLPSGPAQHRGRRSPSETPIAPPSAP